MDEALIHLPPAAPKKDKVNNRQLGEKKQRTERINVCVYKLLEAGKNLKLLARGIQANVNISGLSNVFRRKKMPYLKVNHSSNSDISAVSHEGKPFTICQARKQQQNLNYLLS